MKNNKILNGKMASSVAAASILMLSLGSGMAFPAVSLAAEETRVYTWGNGASRPTIPETIDINGQQYRIKTQGEPTQSTSNNTVSQHFETTRTSTSPTTDNLQSSIPTTVQHSQDGFSGTLNRTRIEAVPISVEESHTSTMDVTGIEVGTSTEHPDDSIIPNTVDRDGRTFTKTGVDWSKDPNTASGWNYVAHYSTTYTTTRVDHYDVTAYYAGTLTKTDTQKGDWSLSVVYESVDQPAQEQPAEQQVPAEPEPQDPVQSDPTDEVTTTEQQGEPLLIDQAPEDSVDSTAIGSDGTAYDADDDGNGQGGFLSWVSSIFGIGSNSEDGNASGGFSLLKVIPWVLGALGLIGLGSIFAALFGKKRKETAVVAAEDNVAMIPQASVAAEALPIDIEDVDSELIEYVDDGSNDNQRVIATCSTVLSPDEDTPTVITIPAPPAEFEPAIATDMEGNQFVDEEGNPVYCDYYLVLGNSSSYPVATGETNANGTAHIRGLQQGQYIVRVTGGQGLEGYSTDEEHIVTIDDGSITNVEFVVTEDDITYDNNDDDATANNGTGEIIATVLDSEGNPMRNVTIGVFLYGILSHAKSDRLVIVSNGQEIYDGVLQDQTLLDTGRLVAALNGTGENDIQGDLAIWNQHAQDYIDRRWEAAMAENQDRFGEQQPSEVVIGNEYDDIDEVDDSVLGQVPSYIPMPVDSAIDDAHGNATGYIHDTTLDGEAEPVDYDDDFDKRFVFDVNDIDVSEREDDAQDDVTEISGSDMPKKRLITLASEDNDDLTKTTVLSPSEYSEFRKTMNENATSEAPSDGEEIHIRPEDYDFVQSLFND